MIKRFGTLLLILISMNLTNRVRADEPAWKHNYATVNGVKLHYVEQGTGTVVLFLHGFPEFWYAWKKQIPEFASTHHSIALDMRGYNLSEKPSRVEDYAMPTLVEDIKAFLDKVTGGKRAILVAHDWGGVVAWAYAAKYPKTLDKLVIINAPHPTIFGREIESNPDQQKASAYMNFFRSAGAESMLSANKYAALAGAVFSSSRPGSFSSEDKAEYLSAWSQPGAVTGGLNYYRAAKVGPPSSTEHEPSGFTGEALPVITVPTFVIWGEKDTALLTGNLKGLEKVVQKLTIHRVANGSHWVVHEEPDEVNRVIRGFISRK